MIQTSSRRRRRRGLAHRILRGHWPDYRLLRGEGVLTRRVCQECVARGGGW
jgi:hypothetical protein